MQSKSSTAGIGVIFLPIIGALAGILGWLFRNFQNANNVGVRILAWIGLVAAGTIIVWELINGVSTIQLNLAREAKYQESLVEIERNRALILSKLSQSKRQETTTIDQLIHEKEKDRNFLIPALKNEFVSADVLDKFAQNDDLGVALTAISNPNCRSETLVKIYRKTNYPEGYFFQPLAAHPHTPPEILREIYYRNPRIITGLDSWFAKNPATPSDVLQDLLNTKDINVVQSLLQNQNLNCKMLGRIEEAMWRSSHPDDSYSVSKLKELKFRLCD